MTDPKPHQRKIIHLDMDCFFAAIEMRDDPALREVPLAVGGSPDKRGVVSTCNYPARGFGVHSAMAMAYALRLCPKLTILPVRMDHYRQVSAQIRDIFSRYTSLIEPLSLDEAYLDVSEVTLHNGSATLIARDIRRAIRDELGLTASAGVAPNKFIAKVCSDENKPDGQFVVTPDEVDAFCRQLPLTRIPGVGKVTAKRLEGLGMTICEDVRQAGEAAMVQHFGSFGALLYRRAHGIDDRPVTTSRIRKSLSVERTFPEDIHALQAVQAPLEKLFAELAGRLENHPDRQIRNQQLKLKFADFSQTTMERASNSLDKSLFYDLLPDAWERGGGKAIRLLGLGVSFRSEDHPHPDNQPALF